MASPCAARAAASPAAGVARARPSPIGASRGACPCVGFFVPRRTVAHAVGALARFLAPGRLSVGRDAHVARGVAPYARDSLTKDVARGRGSGDAAKRERTAKHTFHTEGGRQVHVEVIPVGETYLAIFEVAEDVEHDLHGEPISNTCGELWLHWGMHREWLDEWMSLPEIPAGSQYVEGDEAQRAPRFGQNTAATRTPLVRDGDRSTVVYRRGFPRLRAKFEIPSYYAPPETNRARRKAANGRVPRRGGRRRPTCPSGSTRTTRPPHSPCRRARARVPAPLGASRASSPGRPPAGLENPRCTRARGG